jgi:hypothetical protein
MSSPKNVENPFQNIDRTISSSTSKWTPCHPSKESIVSPTPSKRPSKPTSTICSKKASFANLPHGHPRPSSSSPKREENFASASTIAASTMSLLKIGILYHRRTCYSINFQQPRSTRRLIFAGRIIASELLKVTNGKPPSALAMDSSNILSCPSA